MSDEKVPSPDADEVREEIQSAVQRIRKKFAEGLHPEPEARGESESVEKEPG